MREGSQISIDGVVEAVTYSKPETGYGVLKLRIDPLVRSVLPQSLLNRKGQVTLIGDLASIKPGEKLGVTGELVRHPEFGWQVKVTRCEMMHPTSLLEIELFLAGNVDLIDKYRARLIVSHFGEKTLDVIDQEPERLLEINGIGKKILEQIKKCWVEQAADRELLRFFTRIGLPIRFKEACKKKYGTLKVERDKEEYFNDLKEWKELESKIKNGLISEDLRRPQPSPWKTIPNPQGVIDSITANPYRLVRDIRGVGFQTADVVAKRMGIEETSPFRVQAAMLHVLNEGQSNGDCFQYLQDLVPKTLEFLAVPIPHAAIQDIVADGHANNIIAVDGTKVYSPPIFSCEHFAAEKIAQIMRATSPVDGNLERAESIALTNLPTGVTSLDEAQVEAVKRTLKSKFSIITGGPGVGKTTVLKCVVNGFAALGLPITLMSPTGRAAKRMQEVIGRESSTMHRRLYQIMDGKAEKLYGVVILDEVSMMDVELLASLLKNSYPETIFVMVGDQDQLPSVGPGAVLRDMVASGVIPCSRMTKIFRQAEGSNIIVNAHAINQGRIARYHTLSRSTGYVDSDMLFVQREEPEQIADAVCWLCTTYAKRYGYDPLTDLQVITPGHNGLVGVMALNNRLQSVLNPNPSDSFQVRPDVCWGIGDRMMNVKNNYKYDVLNGDLGTLVNIRRDDRDMVVEVDIDFDGVVKTLPRDWFMSNVHLAYASTVHKVQGSEFKFVVMVCHTSHYMLLQRNLLYTGVTRAKERMVLVNSPNALAQALRNDQVSRRNTYLAERIQQNVGAIEPAFAA